MIDIHFLLGNRIPFLLNESVYSTIKYFPVFLADTVVNEVETKAIR